MNVRGDDFRRNAYLLLAAEALRRERRPLTPIEMLEVAQRDDFVPPHLFGATMHKTLAARLSEHIRRKSHSSSFFRTAPATYYLHSLAEEPGTPDEYRKVFIGN